jgi:MFS family permease
VLLHRLAVKTVFFVNGFIFANWVSRLPRIQELYGADDGTIGLVLLSLSIGAVGAMPFTGWVIIKHGSRKITLYSALLYCAIVSLVPVLPGINSLFILYFFMGIVTGVLDVAMNAQAILVERAYQKSIMTSFHALFSIGMMMGAASSSFFAAIGAGLTSHFFIVASGAVLIVIWLSRNLVHDTPEPA